MNKEIKMHPHSNNQTFPYFDVKMRVSDDPELNFAADDAAKCPLT